MVRITTLVLLICVLSIIFWKALLVADRSTTPLTPPHQRASADRATKYDLSQSQLKFTAHPFSKIRHAVEKPIFLSSRSFGKVLNSNSVKKPQGLDPKNIVIQGIVMFGDQRKALLKVQDQAPQWFFSNQSVAGWKIVAISENAVTLNRKDEQEKVFLYQNE